LTLFIGGCGIGTSPCQAPEPIGHDPVIQDGYVDVNQWIAFGGAGLLVHFLDLAVAPELGRLYGSGSGGFWVFEADGSGDLDYKESWWDQSTDTFSRVTVLQDSHVAVLDRSTGDLSLQQDAVRFNGIRLLDVEKATRIEQVSEIPISDASFVEASGDWLYVLRHQGMLEIYDIRDFTAPRLVSQLTGLGNPRAMTLPDEEGLGWVADSELGLVVLDLDDPRNPVVLSVYSTTGSAVDLARTSNQVFVAMGSDGLETFFVDGQEASSLGALALGGTATQVAVQDGLIWVANVQGFAVLRQRPGMAPAYHGFEPTSLFSLCVEPLPGRQGAAYGGSWSDLFVLQADRNVRAPQLVLESTSLQLEPGSPSGSLTFANRGGADLTVTQIASLAPEFSGTLPTGPISPGAQGTLALNFAEGFQPDVEICLASDDPAASVQTVLISTGDELSVLGLGELAPDFSLPDVDGSWHALSDYRGQPVLLVWFATW
jgi:hypothetical protein